MNETDITEIQSFLHCETPQAWIVEALNQLPMILIDHAHCEKKAASTALTMLYRYVDRYDLLHKLSRLAREELRHFEQVITILKNRDIPYQHLSPSRYASQLHQSVRQDEPYRLIDSLIIGAIIEARSCERFAKLAPHLDPELSKFYRSLLKSESRHYQDYLKLAALYAEDDIAERVNHFLMEEKKLIETRDPNFRFHSGVPVSCVVSA